MEPRRSPTAFEVRPLGPTEEYRWAEELQRRVWGFVDVEVIPLHVLITAQKNGGLVLGAFDASGDGARGADALLGLLFGFPGRDALGAKHCSHILGVAPAARGRGVGAALKWAQRARLLAAGTGRVTWTYDPLVAANGRFNLRKLGAVCRRYLADVYGEIRDDLNRGMPTDRFEVDWWLERPRVAERAAGAPLPPEPDAATIPLATASRAGPGGLRHPAGWSDPDAALVRVEIPADLSALKRADVAAARAWSALLREACGGLFGAGYVATDLLLREGRAFYLLERSDGTR